MDPQAAGNRADCCGRSSSRATQGGGWGACARCTGVARTAHGAVPRPSLLFEPSSQQNDDCTLAMMKFVQVYGTSGGKGAQCADVYTRPGRQDRPAPFSAVQRQLLGHNSRAARCLDASTPELRAPRADRPRPQPRMRAAGGQGATRSFNVTRTSGLHACNEELLPGGCGGEAPGWSGLRCWGLKAYTPAAGQRGHPDGHGRMAPRVLAVCINERR